MSGGGLSLAFTGPARKARRLEVHETIEAVVREEITGVGAGGVQTAGTGNPLADLKVIEAQPNSFKIASGKFVPSYIPEAADRADQEGGIDKFEAAAQDAVDAQGDVTYGLIRRDRTDEASTSRRAQGAGSGAVLGPGDQETLALRRDLTALPEVASLDAYEAMPPGETRAAAAEGPVDNKGAAHIPLAERNPAELGAGEAAWVVVGTHSGLACTFVGLEAKREGRSERARVRLQPSNEVVVVRVSDLSLAAPSRQRSRGKVKVVDKRAEGGRVYLKKGTVVDVAMPRVCDVHLDDLARTVQGLHQDQLETVVPGVEGTPVLLLAGRLREAGAAAVQLTADGSLVKVSLDEVAEYAGPEHDDE
ncbi:Protein MOS2 [Auxenochlorella protothecoides]|uniref:Protein MOS2 n=1 Tax=Auxenochlorella protothecoides TaxID=3075 RepID=A0A087SGY8_AUXPR|nr:Protein MOS2 [Auxenochlorella protothecoides]KFM24992.1 Protein MOS2 [Auxenochlorella protothecoides]